MNDADIEMCELTQLANAAHAAREAGRCPHGGWQGHSPEHRPDLAPGEVECLDCGKRFPSEEALLAASDEVMRG